MLADNIFVIDFETTGVDTKTCQPLELAVLRSDGMAVVQLIKPTIPIPPEASAVHHIVEADVAGMPSWELVKENFSRLIQMVPEPVLAAHNASYEQGVLGEFVPVRWVCTYKCALVVWPDAPGHKNEVLRYWLKLPGIGRSLHQMAHSAYHDVCVTQLLLMKLLEHKSLQELIDISSKPAQLPYIPIGKHYGLKWSDASVPASYLEWLVSTKDMREDVKFCAQAELDRRRGKRATT